MSPDQTTPMQAVDQRGMRGTIDTSVIPPHNAGTKLVLVRFSDGSSVFADASIFVEKEPGVVFYPGSFAALLVQCDVQQSTNTGNTAQSQQTTTAATIQSPPPVAPQSFAQSNQSQTINQQNAGQSFVRDDQQAVIPIVEEQLRIGREQVLTGGVRVHKTVSQRVESVNEPVVTEHLDVERVAVNRFVTEVPTVRYEGDIMIVPLLEGVMVVEKRLVLREEIRLRKRREVLNNPQEVVLRREEVRLERINPNEERFDDEQNTQVRRS